jgi:type II secretory pathway pseudopilin PulG
MEDLALFDQVGDRLENTMAQVQTELLRMLIRQIRLWSGESFVISTQPIEELSSKRGEKDGNYDCNDASGEHRPNDQSAYSIPPSSVPEIVLDMRLGLINQH